MSRRAMVVSVVLIALVLTVVGAVAYAQIRGKVGVPSKTAALRAVSATAATTGVAETTGPTEAVIDLAQNLADKRSELFGYVTLVEGYALPNFTGCHALIRLRDDPNTTIAVLTSEHGLQTLLETALAARKLVGVWVKKYGTPPTPMGGTWSVDAYYVDCVIVYG